MDQEMTIPGTNPVSIKQVKKLADRLPYTKVQIPEIVMGETIQWQNIIPGSYGEDQKGRFFLVTKVVTTIVTIKGTGRGINPVYLCLFQRFSDKENFVEFTSNTTGIFFQLSINSFKEIVDILDGRKGHKVNFYA